MPAKKFSLQGGEPSDLVVSWKRSFKETKIVWRGKLLYTFSGRQELEDGGLVKLPDGSDLDVSLSHGKLILLHDGLPVPGSPKSAHLIVKHAVYAFNLMAFITFLLGAYVVYSFNDVDYLTDSVIFGVYGLLFILCGYLTGQGKKLAAIFGLVLTFFYIWFWVVFLANNVNNTAAFVFLVLHLFAAMKIIKAIPAITRFSLYVTQEE